MTELFILVVVTILSVYAAVRLHEILHYLVARALHYQACFKHAWCSGFPTCPWCIELLPVLDKELQADHGKAYTVDVRGKHYSDADNAIVKKFSQTYTKEDKLYVPFVVAINSSGDVKVHVGMVDDHDATKDKMTKDQEQRLVKILDKMIAFSQS